MAKRKLMRPGILAFLICGAAVVTTPRVYAAVSVARAELSGTRLRIEGQATPNRTITVNGVAMGTSAADGRFRIERDPFAKPADCIVDVNDGSASPTSARLSGCTVDRTATATPVTQLPPTATPISVSRPTATPLTQPTATLRPIGSISIARGGNGHGRITSQPPGIDCTITTEGGVGACNNAFFAAGTEVRLEARAAANSQFLGWEFEVSCPDAPKVVVQAGIAHICRPGFVLR